MSSAAFEFEALEVAPAAVPRAVRVGDAASVLDAAHAEADAIREAARDEGWRAGYEAGLAAANERLAPSASALAAAVEALGEHRAQAADAIEPHAVDLAIRIAEKALGAALEVDPALVVDVVRGGLRRLIERDRVLVLVHPDDLDIVRAAVPSLVSTLGGIGELDVQAERRVARGGAIVRTAAGEVDGRLETQLERARETLLEALGEDRSS